MREFEDGDFPFANEWNAVVRDALTGTCVTVGCVVSGDGTEDFSLSVASGSVAIGGDEYGVNSQTVSLQSADPDQPRYDLVVVGSDGTADAVSGTPSSTPRAPSIPEGHVLLAIVEVPADAAGVTDADVFDSRVVIGSAFLDAGTVNADDVTVSESFTDPSGVTYTGRIGAEPEEQALWYAGV